MIAAITGANGFIGRHLVRQFAAGGWEVRAVTRAEYEADRLTQAFARADVVIHAAGATRAPTRAGLDAANAQLTARTLDAARRAGAGRFVYLSSQAAAGPAASLATPCSEETPPAPIDAYGRSKLEAERLVAAAGLPFVVLRPCAVYGPGDRDFIAMYRLARHGVAVHAANRNQWISIVHVRDLVRGVLQAATDSRATGGVFFLGNEAPVQWADLFGAAAACASRTIVADIEIPRPLVALGARIGDVVARVRGRAGLLTSEKVALSEAAYWVCSSALARERFGFSTPTALQEGLCETYHWYLANGWL